ncbi:MAG: hypothetical protein ACOX5J_04085 [Candidatus Hydrogenedentales bacterium]
MDIDWDLARGSMTFAPSARAEEPPETRSAPVPVSMLPALRAWLSACLEQAQAHAEQTSDATATADDSLPALQSTVVKAGDAPIASLVTPTDGTPLYAAEGQTIHALSLSGERMGSFSTDGSIRMLHWWPEPQLLLAGCTDEKVIAFDRDGNRQWEFVSKMDPEV